MNGDIILRCGFVGGGGAMGLFEDAAERVPKLVRVIFRGVSQDDAEEIVQRVLVKLLALPPQKLTVPFVWRVIYTTGVDYFREKGRHVPLPEQYEPPPPSGPPNRVPLVIVMERLRIADESGSLPALAFGYHTHAGYTPEEIAINLAAVCLEDLAQSLLKKYADAADVPEAQIVPSFRHTLAVVGTPGGAETFQDHWKPEDEVEKWIQDVQKAVAASTSMPSGVARPDLRPAIKKAPNRRIAFSYGSSLGLGCRPARIVAAHGNQTLEFLQTDFEAQYRAQDPHPQIPLDDWKPVVAVLGEAAQRELQSYYTPTRTVGRWVEHARRRLESEDLKQEKSGLEAIFGFRRYTPEESMAMLYTVEGFMGVHHTDVWRLLEKSDLSEMERSLLERYQSKWGFEKDDVARWFRPLSEALENQGTQSQLVVNCFPTPERIRLAGKKVLGVVKPGFQGGSQFPLFGWRHNLL